MIDALQGFLDELRARGVELSPADAIAAVRALAASGIESREAVRLGLAVTCAKTRAERASFAEAFERYFAPPARLRSGGAPGAGGAAGTGRSADSESGPAGNRARDGERKAEPDRRTGPRDPALRPRRPSVAPPPRTRPQAAGSPLVRELQRKARRRDGRLRAVLVERKEPREARRGEGRPAGPSTRAQEAPQDSAAGSLRRRDLRLPASADVDRKLLDEAARIVAELRLGRGRRLEPGRRGRLALKRTLRASLATFGVPFRIHRARRKLRRPRVVLLVDVSYSVTRAAGLFLRLAASLLEAAARTTVVAFVDRPCEATSALLAWARGGRPAGTESAAPAGSGRMVPAGGSFAGALRGVGGLDLSAASDYGRTFFALLSEPALRKRGDLVLLVLGDGRTNRYERLPWAFAELASRARRVIWVVPERTATWGTGDSALGDYLPEADLAVEGADLEGLVRGLRALLRTVGA